MSHIVLWNAEISKIGRIGTRYWALTVIVIKGPEVIQKWTAPDAEEENFGNKPSQYNICD
jgi:hypothetical protein